MNTETDFDRDDVKHWFAEWREGTASHFAARLFDLIAKADRSNRERLRRGFPLFVQVFEIEMGR